MAKGKKIEIEIVGELPPFTMEEEDYIYGNKRLNVNLRTVIQNGQ
jgi:hypothetical protein